MKYKILSIFTLLILAVTLASAQTKIGQLAPCLDAAGAPLAGCQIISGTDGKYKQVVFAACLCVDGNVIKKYVNAKNYADTCHTEILPGLCNEEQVVVNPITESSSFGLCSSTITETSSFGLCSSTITETSSFGSC